MIFHCLTLLSFKCKLLHVIIFSDEFRATACKQNIHTRILRLMQSRPNHSLLIESSLEVLIIFTELREWKPHSVNVELKKFLFGFSEPNMHIMLNDGKLFEEVMKILEKNKSESKPL